MQIVLGISEGSWVDIGVVVVPIILVGLGTFAYLKIKSKIMVDVKKEIDEEIEPIRERLGQHEADFKDYKREVIEPMRETINQLITKQTVIDVKIDGISEGITDIKKLIGKVFDELNNKKDK